MTQIDLLPVPEALRIVRAQTAQLEPETIELATARGRVLAEDVIADSDLPPFDRALMDGYAVRAEDTAAAPVRLRIVGEAAAGRGWRGALQAGEAVRIMTGAPVPRGADEVVELEKTAPGSRPGRVAVRLARGPGEQLPESS